MVRLISSNAPARPALRYHGAKWNLAPWILSHFPGHDVYVEPFAGSAAVLLQKSRSPIEVYNDLDGELVNFFRVLRTDPDLLIRAIKLTPFAKAEWELSFEQTDDPIEAARRFYCRSYMSIAGPTAQWGTGWRRQKVFFRERGGGRGMTPAAVSFANVDHLYQVAERFRAVIVEQAQALEIIKRYDGPGTLFYLDPPYVFSTRSKWRGKAYAHDDMSDRDHEKLALAARACKGLVLLSGYRCDLYDSLYHDWTRFDRTARVNGENEAVESLWLSPRTIEALNYRRLPLFAHLENKQ